MRGLVKAALPLAAAGVGHPHPIAGAQDIAGAEGLAAQLDLGLARPEVQLVVGDEVGEVLEGGLVELHRLAARHRDLAARRIELAVDVGERLRARVVVAEVAADLELLALEAVRDDFMVDLETLGAVLDDVMGHSTIADGQGGFGVLLILLRHDWTSREQRQGDDGELEHGISMRVQGSMKAR